ncbi:MAG: DUF1385 domain-containing protein, partial [Candidatus Woesearchaeota archaeon]
EVLLGGQAVIEGVMMRAGDSVAVAVRKPNGKIAVKKEKIIPLSKKYPVLKLPLLRGVIALYDSLVIGTKTLIFSAEESTDGEEKITSKELYITFGVAIVFAIGIFVLLPLFLTSLTRQSGVTFNIIDGILRLVFFIIYLVAISSFKDVKRMFAYHGAEHMAVHCHEEKKPLTVKNVRKFSTAHARCGTSFLLIVLLISIAVFSIVNPDNFLLKFLSRILLIPLIAGISYELLRFSAKFSKNFIGRAIAYPGMLLQRITTKKPDDGQIKVAIAALKALSTSSA